MPVSPETPGIHHPASRTPDLRPRHGSDIQRLALQALSGEERAFEQLYHSLSNPLSGFFSKHLDADSGEELAHQTLTESFRALRDGRYHPKRALFLTFVYGVATNIRLRELRSRGRARDRFPGLIDAAAGSSPLERAAAGPDWEIDWEQLEAVRECLACETGPLSLAPEERFVVIGRAERKSLQALAAQLRRSLDSVHRWERRGLEKIRKCMAFKGFS